MTPHLSANLLSPYIDDMVYAPYQPRCSTSKPRRSTQLSAEMRADIVARVLDPAYSGRHREDYSSRVLIDTNGDEHDPDYQLFPTIYPTRPRQTPSGFFRRVPSDDELTQDDDDDAESIIAWTRERAVSPMTSSGSSACTPSPPPNPLALFGDDEWDEKEWTKEVVVPVPAHKRRKSKAVVYVPNSPPIQPMPSFDEPEPEYSPARHSTVKLVREDTMDTDETPSCGYVLRRQWATFALQTRLSAHRIARRARRVVSVGT
ncbi:unnamed protein product [Rhizoctonia solani]|uniref:Uncharacterized protein n=2 Tax=Rhizoctonia solani AG-3 TaxID=1086053 RepID=A0A074RYS6_9AGAM|nr:hypothetical protein RSOL_313850 [Rhizoctonia solani AG-3 Rhs1AP]KEP50465.1 hypothetical protein V565_079480 [Rhizoctonia solani 123E]CAE6514479.1 unnamed protein product [Rhizoctonia solani]